MTNAAGQIKAGTSLSPRRRRRPTRSETVTRADTAKLITAIRLTTDVITFIAIVVTIIVLAAGMIVAPFAIANWYPPNFSQISDNLRDRLGEAGLIAPADPLVLDRNCANEDPGCFHEFGEVVEEGAPQ